MATPCPICDKTASPEHAPFCSKRCHERDLHRWLTGRYTIPTEEEHPDDEAPPQQEYSS